MAKRMNARQRRQPEKKGRGSVAPARAGRKTAASAVNPFWVCGIGASAGGLEAFTQLLRALPADTGVAFVLVQHLDPKHESLLRELLARTTTMPVLEVEDGMPVKPNHIYVIPRNRNMTITDDVLRLLPRLETRGQHMPVDFFFRSMAENLGERAIGVILSGSASDGAAGLKAIKAEGGITFAQDEKSAKYDSMPRSAVAAGAVDFVLPPEEIAMELARIGRHAVAAHPKGTAAEEIVVEGGDAFHRILALLYKVTSLDFTYYKQPTIKRRIARRMMMLAMQNIDDYVAHLQKNPAEVEALGQDILIHVTGFFRDPRTFGALKSKVLPRIVRSSSKDAPIRIWVPGCSTGEEAYSLAICLFEYFEDHPIARPAQIFATDVSDLAIDKARAGEYSATIASEVSPERLRRFFVKLEGGGYQISKAIRDICIFAKQDITKDPPFSNMDLISCRNVQVHVGTVLQRRVLSLFHYALRPTGILTLGTAESISGFTDLFTPMDTKYRFYTKKPHRGNQADVAGGVYEMGKGTAASKPVLPPPPDLYREVDRILLRRYVPPAVLINEKLDILQFRGRTSPYLEPSPGEASLNLTRMAREGLMI